MDDVDSFVAGAELDYGQLEVLRRIESETPPISGIDIVTHMFLRVDHDSLRVGEQRAGDELRGRCRDLAGQPIGEGPASWGSPARTGRSRGAAAFDQRADGLGAVDDITRADGLACLGEGAQCVGVGLDLHGLAEGEVGLDGVHYFLLHAAVVFLGGGPQLGVEVGGKT